MNSALLVRGAIILIDKPEGLTSHDVVERVRKTTGVAKIGHTGTLDPMATGLLVLCGGRAARLQGFLTGLPKSYEGVIAFGRATTTYDREGETVGGETADISFTKEELERAAEAFRGEFEQLPPPYSAKKIGGRRFYEIARKGETVPDLPKKVTVSEFEIASAGREVAFQLSCSSGTYVRSIAHNLGRALGCGAHLSRLRRTRVGPFDLKDAAPLELFEQKNDADRLSPPHTVPLAEIPFPFPRMPVASLEAWKIRRGQAIPARLSGKEGDWVALLGADGEMLALGQMTPVGTGKIAMIKPKIVLAD